jgi:hypothetical protein
MPARDQRSDRTCQRSDAGAPKQSRHQETRSLEYIRGRRNVRIEEASMHTRFIPRLLVLSLMLAFVFSTALQSRASASDHTRWNDTVSVEDALVQSCYGFNVTGSYTADRAFEVVENYDGSQFYERRNVTFAGALGNATSGKSYAYDGQFTRIASPGLGKVKISNLSLRFEVDTPGEFTYSLDQVDFNLSDNPQLIVKTIVQHALQMDVCQLFGGSTIGYGPIIPSSHPSADINAEDTALPQAVNVHTENSALEQSVAPYDERSVSNPSIVVPSESSVLIPPTYYGSIEDSEDDMTPWTELDPCDTSPPGKPC